VLWPLDLLVLAGVLGVPGAMLGAPVQLAVSGGDTRIAKLWLIGVAARGGADGRVRAGRPQTSGPETGLRHPARHRPADTPCGLPPLPLRPLYTTPTVRVLSNVPGHA
jgi:hypothetical protein